MKMDTRRSLILISPLPWSSRWLRSIRRQSQTWPTSRWMCDNFNSRMVLLIASSIKVPLTQYAAAMVPDQTLRRCSPRFIESSNQMASSSACPSAKISLECLTLLAATSSGKSPTRWSKSPCSQTNQSWVLSSMRTESITGSTLCASRETRFQKRSEINSKFKLIKTF